MKKKKKRFRLPTKEEFENLIEKFTYWDCERGVFEIMNGHGEILFFPAVGYYRGTTYKGTDSDGYYWSSTMDENDSDYAYNFYFDSNYKDVSPDDRTYRQSIRLVSDTPFESGVEFNGVWWKPKNENGYFTFDKAIEKFDKKQL